MAEDVELAESVSIAMLTVLETLGPVERAVFVLREVFDVPYDEIAEAVDKSSAAVRQIAHRAREHVHARAGRGCRSAEPSRRRWSSGSAPRCRPATSRACSTSSRRTWCWSPTAAAWSRRRFARCPVRRRSRGSSPASREFTGGVRVEPMWLNGAPALRIDPAGEFDSAVSLAVEGGRITRIYVIRNPHKLAGLDHVAVLTR